MSINVAKIMHRTVCTLCCTILALSFETWWFILLSIPVGMLTGLIFIELETESDSND